MSKRTFGPVALNTATSLSSAFTTPVTTATFQDNISYQITITSSDSTGTFNLQASNDGLTWINTGNTILAQAANDTGLIQINQWPNNFMRLSYTPTIAGTGTCSIVIFGKTVGA